MYSYDYESPDCETIIFELENADGIQRIHHFSEQPEYSMEYLLSAFSPSAPGNEL